VSHEIIAKVRQNVELAVLGKQKAIKLCAVALMAGGHILLEDAPGLGKTSLARALARTLGCRFTRIQFTPDLLPSDILGANIFRPNSGDFEFRAGPVFTNVLLADEINRTTPRTQSALLEAMSERQVSIEGVTHSLGTPFLVIATQNPYEYEGTYPLPENQLDRFMMCLDLGYPDRETERLILRQHREGQPVESLSPVIDVDQLVQIQKEVCNVRVDDSISDYMLEIAGRTRSHSDLVLGVSTRGALTLYRAAQALALTEGRNYVIPDDVKEIAVPVLAHRVVCRGVFREGHRQRASQVLRGLLDSLPVPI
jgi:MoxR-like ATPase